LTNGFIALVVFYVRILSDAKRYLKTEKNFSSLFALTQKRSKKSQVNSEVIASHQPLVTPTCQSFSRFPSRKTRTSGYCGLITNWMNSLYVT